MRYPPFSVANLKDGDAASLGSSDRPDERSAGEEKSARCAFRPTGLPTLVVSVAPIDLAIEACHRAHAEGGALSAWGAAAAPTLGACLQVLEAINGNPEAEARLYEAVATLKLPGKTPIRKKTVLLAVLLCQQLQTSKVRKECARFACLVIAAREAGTRPEQAVAYLATTTLSEAVAATRKGGDGARRVANPIHKAYHPTLWAALSGSDSEVKAQAEKLVAAALKRAEDWLREHAGEGSHDAR